MPREATDPHDLSAPLERCPVCQRGGHTDDAHKRKIDPTSPPKALYAYAYDGGDVDSVWAKLCAHDASRFVHNDRWPSGTNWVLPPTKYVLATDAEAATEAARAKGRKEGVFAMHVAIADRFGWDTAGEIERDMEAGRKDETP